MLRVGDLKDRARYGAFILEKREASIESMMSSMRELVKTTGEGSKLKAWIVGRVRSKREIAKLSEGIHRYLHSHEA